MKSVAIILQNIARRACWACVLMTLMCLSEATAGITSVKQNAGKMTSLSSGLGQTDYNKEALFTGGVSFPLTLVTVGSLDVQIQYSSNVHKQVRTENRVAPSGWIGMGWSLTLGSIVGEIGGTADTSDDRYHYTDSEGSTDIIKLPSGAFVMQQYKVWRVTRHDSSGIVVGWTIMKEDGTIMRFGNYHPGERRFSLALDSSYATRCHLGFNGIVENPATSLYGSAALIPYQWDLADVQDIQGNHTTVTYQQVTAQLSLGGSSTSRFYTRESHPSTISDNKGGELEFVLANLNSDEYYGQSQTFTQNIFESKRLDTLRLKRNGQTYEKVALKTLASQDILTIGAKKRYLTQIDVLDRSGNSMLVSKFDYCGLSGEALGANPGALRRVTYRTGGCTEYTYKAQALPLGTLSLTNLLSPSMKYDCATTDPNPTGIAGNDFYVISSSIYRNIRNDGSFPDSIKPIQVLRLGPTGWHLDSTFPYDSVGFCQAGHDYIVGYFDERWKLVKRSGEGWMTYDIEDAFAADSITINAAGRARMGPIGLGPNYFVFKYNLVLPVYNGDFIFSLAAVRLTEAGLKVSVLGSGYHETHAGIIDGTQYIMHMWADCAENYFIVSSRNEGNVCCTGMVGSHFKWRNGAWVNLMDKRVVQQISPWDGDTSAVKFPSTVPSHQIGRNFVVSKYPGGWKQVVVYRDSGGALVTIDSLEEGDINTIVVGDFFYGVGYKAAGSCPWVKTWSGTGWSARAYLSTYFPGQNSLDQASSFSSGNRLVFAGIATDSTYRLHLFSLTHDGSDWAKPNHFVADTCDFPHLGSFSENAFLVEMRRGSVDRVDCAVKCYTFVGDSIRTSTVVPSATAFLRSATHWYTQPGRNFVLSFNILNFCPWADTNHVYAQGWDANGDASFTGTSYDFVLDTKVVLPGTGDSLKTTYAFEYGSIDEQVSYGRYNKVTVTPPGNSGKTVTYFYNDLGPDQASEFVAAKNYLALDGKPYRIKEYNSSNDVVREANQLWAAEAIDSIRGVFFEELLVDSTLTDGVARVASYEYGNPLHLHVTKITETNSDGTTQRITRMKYPLDYPSTSPSSGDAMVRVLDSMKTVSHIVNAVIEKWVYRKSGSDTSSFLAGEVTTYRQFAPGQILPDQSLKVCDSLVNNFAPSASDTSLFTCDSRYVPVSTIQQYSPYGQVRQATDANGVASTTLWSYSSAVPVASIVNARTTQGAVGGEGSYIGFESVAGIPVSARDSSDLDYWTLYREDSYNLRYGDAHTGYFCQKLPGYNQTPVAPDGQRYGPTRDFLPPDLAGQRRTYVASCWVKTESGFSAGNARLVAYPKVNADLPNTVYPSGNYQCVTTGYTNGSWVYLEVRVDLKTIRQTAGIPDGELLRIRIYPQNNDATHYMLVDDLRVYPLDGLVTETTAYHSLFLLPTSRSDASGIFTATSYDGFGRPIQVKNAQGSLLKEFSYFYSRDAHGGAFSATDPNYTREKSYRAGSDTTTLKTYTDGLGREIQKQVFYGNDDIIFHTVYDSLSRPRYLYKPYQVNLDTAKHTYDGSYASHVSSYYDTLTTLGSTPFAETRYWRDPLNRVQAQGAPGDAFAAGAGHDVRIDYLGDQTNKRNTTLTRNEQGDSTKLSKDLFGNTVRSEVLMGTSAPLITAFTYDVLGNLTRSTPPLGENYSSSYMYTTRSELREKSSPDAGTARYLYDKNANLRLIRDAAHTGSGASSVNISSSIAPGGQTSGNFTLNNRGKVNVTLNGPGVPVQGGTVTLQVKTAGGVVMLTLVTTGVPQSSSLILPQGTYSYFVRSTSSDYPSTPYAIQCQTQYPFAFKKYDALGRVIQEGELDAADASGFTQAWADSASYPTSGYILTKSFFYDTTSADAMAAGQNNVQGRLSKALSYRLGTLALTTFYSYDNMGRVEWVVQKGLGSASKKIYYSYDLQGNVINKSYADAYDTANNHSWWYEYDPAGRPTAVYSGADSASRVKEAESSYLASGREQQLALGVAPAQTVNYTYTQRDWLKSLISAQYWQTLGYEDSLEVGAMVGAPRQYNGNISWMSYSIAAAPFTWGPPVSTTNVGYGFAYDKAKRLASANFGFKYNDIWSTSNSYNIPYIGYDENGNIDSLVRYGTNATLMDNLKYRYLANCNRLEYIDDEISSSAFDSIDVDDQQSGAYRYDGNGNVQADTSRRLALIVYDMNNLPVSEYKTDGTLIQYAYDAAGVRVQKTVGAGAPVWYVGGADGKTELVYNGSTSNPSYNLLGAGGALIGQVKRSGAALNRSYHLKDHLGTVRVTVSPTMIVENFSSDLSQWTTVLGSGFAIESGWLSASSGGADNVMVNSSSATIGDGVISCDVSSPRPPPSQTDVSVVVRYVNTSNYYLVYPYSNRLKIYKKLSGVYAMKVDVALPDGIMQQDAWYHMQVTLSGSNIKVSWNGQQLINWTDPSNPFLSGKVGFRQDNGWHAHWDNFVAWSTGAPTVLAYDDYYPFGQYMDGRSWNNGFADARYKYTEKERDSETGYDYFGARYYDARVGRWSSTEPLAEKYAGLSPYAYVNNNPWRNIDPDGKDILDYLKGVAVSVVQSVNPSYQAPSVESVSGNRFDYAAGRVAGDVVGMVIGAGEVVGGYGGAAAGVTMSGTGVGAIAGVPLAVAGVAVAAHGVMTTVVAASHLGGDANALMNQNTSSGTAATETGSFGEKVKDVKSAPENWQKTSAHTEKSTRTGGRKSGTSVQEVLENKQTGEKMIKHTVTNNKGKVVDEHYRPDYRPREGDLEK